MSSTSHSHGVLTCRFARLLSHSIHKGNGLQQDYFDLQMKRFPVQWDIAAKSSHGGKCKRILYIWYVYDMEPSGVSCEYKGKLTSGLSECNQV